MLSSDKNSLMLWTYLTIVTVKRTIPLEIYLSNLNNQPVISLVVNVVVSLSNPFLTDKTNS